MTDKTDALVAALRELRDTGDVSDWRAMETALTAAIEALAEQPAGVVGESVWLFKSGQQWFPFHNEQHRKDTIADGRWDVREFYTNPPAASVDVEGLRALANQIERWADLLHVGSGDACEWAASIRRLIDSAGGAKENEPFGNSEQLRQAAAGFLAASFYPDGDGYTDDMRQTYSYWHKRLLAELRPAGVMEYVQAEASARINARREAASA